MAGERRQLGLGDGYEPHARPAASGTFAEAPAQNDQDFPYYRTFGSVKTHMSHKDGSEAFVTACFVRSQCVIVFAVAHRWSRHAMSSSPHTAVVAIT